MPFNGGSLQPDSPLEQQIYFSLTNAGAVLSVEKSHNNYFVALDMPKEDFLKIANSAIEFVATRWANSGFSNTESIAYLYFHGLFKVCPQNWKTDYVEVHDGGKTFIDIRNKFLHHDMKNRFKDECKEEILHRLNQNLKVKYG